MLRTLLLREGRYIQRYEVGKRLRLPKPSTVDAAAPQTRVFLSTSAKEGAAAAPPPTAEKASLKDTVHRIQQDKGDSAATGSTADGGGGGTLLDGLLPRVAALTDALRAEVRLAWQELLNSGQRRDINKRIHPVATAEGDAPYTGPVDILVIDPAENLSAWERMQRRLTEAPIIADVLQRTERVYEASGAKRAKERLDDIKEDAKEAWETSQNVWVYRVSNVYDTLTAETPESIAVRELRQLDPTFTLEEWKQDVVEHTLPNIMKWLLEGRINQLKPWLGEGVFKRIAAEIKAREQEGVEIDTHVLGIMNSEILAVEPDEVEKGSPIIVLHFMCQQINCTRRKKDGQIVEGAEDDVRANSYVAAFQREYNAERGELNWRIVDFRFNGAIAYL